LSETIRTIEIAAAIGTAIGSVVGTLSPAPVVRWEPNRSRTSLTDDSLTRPNVNIRVHEIFNNEFAQNTRLRECNVTIQAQTDYADDPGQVSLAEIGQAVGQWILTPPTLSLSLSNFRRLSLPAAPTRDETIDRVQIVTWECVVGVMYPTT
jgi:hypothetical protein